MKLDPMSDEQRVVYEHIRSGKNVVVDACAGSGKSTTILSIATCMPDHAFIQLTYNSMLCAEIKTKADELGLSNLRIYTYHSLAVKYYSNAGYTDTMIRRVLNHQSPPRTAIPRINILVIDETQDMTMLYFKLVVKFCKDHGDPIQLLILGDFMQGLYEFKGADTRFLTNAPEIWGGFPLLSCQEFVKCSLKMSYRITCQMADFVNDVMLGEKRLLACKNGVPVVYLRRSVYDAEKYVVYQITRLLNECGVSPSDIFVLGSSVKGVRSAIRKMENALVEKNVPCHVPMMETDKIDERVINGKVVFSTFHSVKGRQRKYVFVMGFDQSYFKFFARNLPHHICPNTMYVACTRATHGLVVIENHNKREDRPLTFMKMTHGEIQQHPSIEFKGLPQTVFYDNEEKDKNGNTTTHYITPTELIKFIPENVIERILPVLEKIFVKVNDEETESMIDIPTVFETKAKFHEDVSDLNGIAIPLMYFDKMMETYDKSYAPMQGGGNLLHDIIQSDMDALKPNEHPFLRRTVANLPTSCKTIPEYLRLANVFVAVREKLYFKVNQIAEDEYTWLNEEMINECFERIHNILYHECCVVVDSSLATPTGSEDACELDFMVKIEKTIVNATDDAIHAKIDQYLREYFPTEAFRFTARVDAITDKSVWEIKCVGELTNDHFLQVVIYAWLWRFCIEDIEHLEHIRDFRIFNIRSGEIYRLEAETPDLTYIMIELLKAKYGSPENTDNREFIEHCKSFL
jgi:hypothetical protein